MILKKSRYASVSGFYYPILRHIKKGKSEKSRKRRRNTEQYVSGSINRKRRRTEMKHKKRNSRREHVKEVLWEA